MTQRLCEKATNPVLISIERWHVLRFLSTLVFIALTACGEKSELDKRLEVLCKQDGGIRVFEKIQLPSNILDQQGGARMELVGNDGRREIVYANAYVERQQMDVLKAGDPLKGQGRLVRSHNTLSRISDNKVLGESVLYIRAGGDGFHLGHHTQTLCPAGQSLLVDAVFQINK